MASKKPRAKFVCDENFPRTFGKFLKSRGISITELPSTLKGRGLSDANVLRLATKQGRILLTEDQDFLNDPKHAGLITDSLGVVRFVSPPPNTQARERIANQFIKSFSQAKIRGRVFEVTETTSKYTEPQTS